MKISGVNRLMLLWRGLLCLACVALAQTLPADHSGEIGGAFPVLEQEVSPVEDIVKEGNVLSNVDFMEIQDGLPAGWKPERGWAGKSEYALEEGALVIRREEGQEGSGAFSTPAVSLAKATYVQVGGEVKASGLSGVARIMVQFCNAAGQSVLSVPVGQLEQDGGWRRFSKTLKVPAECQNIRMFLIVNGLGNAYFRRPFVSTKLPPLPDNLDTAPYILNGSFEGADFQESFVDCYHVRKGQAQRAAEAFHGCHGLRLEPGAEVIYGNEGAVPIAVKAGERLELSLAAKGPGRAQARLEFVDDNGVNLGVAACDAKPLEEFWLRGVSYVEVPANATGARLMVANPDSLPVVVDALHLGPRPFSPESCLTVPVAEVLHDGETARAFLPSQVREHNGVPTWFMDGEPMTGAMFTLSNSTAGVAKSWYNYERKTMRYGQFPVTLISASISSHPDNTEYTMEQALRDIDFQIRMCLAEVPDAKFILWLFLEGCSDFAEEYPQDIIVNEQTELPWKDEVKPYSYGSEAWGRLCARQVSLLLKEIAGKPYASRIVGVSPGMGRYGENNWGHAEVKGGYTPNDFSPAMQNFFRCWLFLQYGGDVRTFAKVWNRQGRFNFTNAQVPGTRIRLERSCGSFYDPKTDRQTLDYLRCESFSILHRVLQQCEAVKKATDGRLFTFTQFGYFSGWIYHRDLAAALENPCLDAIGPAPAYINRGPGDDIADHGPAASVRAHGKVWLFQADVRTHLADQHNWRYGRTRNEEESVSVFLRDLGHYMTTGTVPYYLCFEPWYNSPKMWEIVSSFQRNLNLAAQFPRRSAAEIAVVVDTDSLCLGFDYSYVTRTMPVQQSAVEYNRLFEWHHLGTPYDFFLLDDLLASPDLERYKVVVFAANSVVSEEQRQLINERLRKDGRMLIWVYAPGIVAKRGVEMELDTKYASGLTGFSLQRDEGRKDLSVRLADGRVFGRFTTDIYGDFTTPDKPVKVRPESFHPSFSVVPDGDAEIFGTFAEDGAPAAAIRRHDGWTDVFWGSTALNKEVLLPLLAQARVHLYAEAPAVVYANRNFLMVHSPVEGKRVISLPRKVECVFDLYGGREVAAQTDRLEVEMDKNSTLLLYCGGRKALEEALRKVDGELQGRKAENAARQPEFAHEWTRKPPQGKRVSPEGLYQPDEEGFIRNWLFLGPFPSYGNGGIEVDFLDGEAIAVPKAGKAMDVLFDATTSDRLKEASGWFGEEGQKETLHIQWLPMQFSKGHLETLYDEFTAEELPFSDSIVYYLACQVISEKEQKVILGIGSDDDEKCWLNGELVTQCKSTGRACVPESETALVTLKPGRNTLLVKIAQGGGGVGHAVRFLEPDSRRPVPGLTISLE